MQPRPAPHFVAAMTRPFLRTARLAGIVVLLAVAWVLWPTALGGGTTYVATQGNSMQPLLHTGDLVVVRGAGGYEVGDVVAYDSPSLRTTVLHRIVERKGDRFVTGGDNNSWLDPDQPTAEDILGRQWLTVPQGGHWLRVLRSPFVLGPLLGVAVLAVLLPAKKRRAQARHGAPSASAAKRDVPQRIARPGGSLALSPRAQAHARHTMLGLAAVVAVAALAAVALLIHPAVRSADQTATVTQQGRFGYEGTATVGATYPDGLIETGDPIYTRLLQGLTVTFTDSVTSATPVEGTVRLGVTVTTPDGWSAPLTTGDAADFTDGTASASVPIDVAAAAALIARHESEVGSESGSASLTVTPAVDLSGAAEGRAFTAPFEAGLTFVLDSVSVRADDAPGSLAPTAETAVPVRSLVPTSFTAFGQTLPIVTARRIAGAVLLLALAGSLVAWSLGRRRPSDDVERFLARHGARVVPVSGFTLGALVVDVEDGATLARVAERNEQFLLHHTAADRHTFLVQDDATTYRFVIPIAAPDAAPPPLVHPLPRIA
jgi:signal peptidase I